MRSPGMRVPSSPVQATSNGTWRPSRVNRITAPGVPRYRVMRGMTPTPTAPGV